MSGFSPGFSSGFSRVINSGNPFDYILVSDPMVYIPKRKPVVPVEINWSLGITEKLTGCFLFRRNSIYKNHVHHMPDIEVLPGSADLTSLGNDAFVDDIANYTLGLDNALINEATTFGAEDHTLFFVMDFRKSTTANNDQYLVISQPGAGTNDAAMYLNNTGSSGRLGSFGTSLLEVTSREPNFTPWFDSTVARTYQSTGGNETLYVDGGTLAGGGENSGSGRSYPDAFLNDYMYLFPDLAITGRRLLAVAKCFYFFNRRLSDQEIALLHKDPYHFLMPI